MHGIRIVDIETLDLTMVKRKLQDPIEGLGWDQQQCDEVEKEYRRFLALKRTYRDREIVPNHAVDAFWHQHILDTEAYARDCSILFGDFLHHYPYFGMNGDDDAKALTSAFEETARLYEEVFGESYDDAATKCRTACKPVKCR